MHIYNIGWSLSVYFLFTNAVQILQAGSTVHNNYYRMETAYTNFARIPQLFKGSKLIYFT